ncbi:MAG: NINE protein [Candidatus Microsaccharimonas sp.]
MEPKTSPTIQTQPSLPTNQESEPRNLLAAFALVILLGYTGVHQLYLGNKTQGWVRIGIFLASIPLLFVFVGFLSFIVLYVWAIVDFFLIYLKRVDSEGKPLVGTNRDIKATKALFIGTIIFVAIYALLLVASIVISLALGQSYGAPTGTFESSLYNSY